MKRTIRRRRLEAKTDYKSRILLLKSGKNRLIIRRTNRYIVAQIVSSALAQDKVITGATSKDLISKGWPEKNKGSLKNLQAAYLTGFLLGKKSKDKVKEVILDMGMHRNIQKSRLYSCLKGLADSGVKVNYSEKATPTLEDLEKNKDFKEIFKKVKEGI